MGMVSCTTSQPPYLTSTYAGITLNLNFYRPQTKLRKGNVFTSVCQKFCTQRGVFAGHPPPTADGYCSGRYASYWNAFLLRAVLSQQIIVMQSRNSLDLHTLAKIKYNLLTEHSTHKGSSTFSNLLWLSVVGSFMQT